LPELIGVIQQRRENGIDPAQLMPQLDPFLRFFQPENFCTACGAGLVKVFQPTAALAPDSAAYRNTARANLMLDAKDRLIAMRKLPMEIDDGPA